MLSSRRVFLATGAAAIIPGARAEIRPDLEGSYGTAQFTSIMARAAALFRELGGGNIRFRNPVPPNEPEHLQLTMRWNVVGDLPDLSLQANNSLRQLASAGLAQPLNGLADQDPDWKPAGTSAAVAEIGRIGRNLYGIPFQVSIPIIIVNLDLARRAGFDGGALPADWDGILALARKIHAATGVMGGFFDFGAAWSFQALITSQGGSMATPDEQDVAFTGPEGAEAMRIVRGFGEAGMLDLSQTQALQAVSAGTVGLFVTSSNFLGAIMRNSGSSFQIGTIPFPLPSPTGKIPAGGRSGVIFARDSAKQAEAWKFLRLLMSPEMQAVVVRAIGTVPLDPVAAMRPEILGDYDRSNPLHAAGLARVGALTEWYSYPGENTVKIIEVMIDHLRSVARLQVPTQQALEAMGRDVRALIRKPA